MLKYVKLKESMEVPCMICGGESNMFMVKALRHTNKYSFYICERCFKSFKKDILDANIKKCSEKDLSSILTEANKDKKELDKYILV